MIPTSAAPPLGTRLGTLEHPPDLHGSLEHLLDHLGGRDEHLLDLLGGECQV